MAAPSAAMPPGSVVALRLDPTGFVDDLYNSAHTTCADSFDALDRVIRQELPVCSPAEQATLTHGTATLYTALREELDQQLQKFEQYALETCLHVPAGLMAQTAAAAEGEAGDVDEAEEAAADENLVCLRAEIAAAKLAGRRMKAELRAFDDALASYGDFSKLQAVAAVLAGKENAAADAMTLATTGMRVEAGLSELDRLRILRAERASEQPRSDLAVEKDILRRQPLQKSAPADDLSRLQERLAA